MDISSLEVDLFLRLLQETYIVKSFVLESKPMDMMSRNLWIDFRFRVETYGYDVCSRVLTHAHVCSRMLWYAHVCSRMLTYAHVCSRMVAPAGFPKDSQPSWTQPKDMIVRAREGLAQVSMRPSATSV
jgi:hypothetical protein